MNVKLPRLLDRRLQEVRRLHPKTQSAEINLEPLSVATLALQAGEGVRVRDFIELYTSRGTAGIFRVKEPNNGYGTYTDTVSLEHGVCVLGDGIIPAEGTITGTPREVFTFLMGYQAAKIDGVPMWALGDVEAPDTEKITYDYRHSNTLHALLDVLDMLDGYMMAFDQSAFPWVLHIRKIETEPSCEGRLGRNINTAHVTIDDSELCTRVYCERLQGGYMQLTDEPEWGIVEHSLEFDEEIPLEKVEEECRKYLEARKEPAVSVEIDGLELAAVTGEALDAFDVGRVMRLALPAYGVTINERITAISYAEMIGQPETVRVYLANQLEDAATSVSSLKAEAASNIQWRTKIEKTTTNLKKSDEGIKEVNEKFLSWFASVEIDLDATVDGAKLGMLASYEEVAAFGEEFDRRISDAELVLYGGPGTAVAGLVARVDENAAAIIATATDLGTRIDLKADKTYVNDLIADEIEAAKSEIEYAISENILTDYLIAYNNIQSYGWIEAPTIKATSGLEFKGESVNKTTIPIVKSVDGGVATVQEFEILNTGSGAEYTMNLAGASEETLKQLIQEALGNLDEIDTQAATIGMLTVNSLTNFNGGVYANKSLTVGENANVSGSVTAAAVDTNTLKFKGSLLKLHEKSIVTGGKISEGATYANYPVYKDGVQVGSVNIPSTWKFTPTYGEKITYLGVDESED